MEITKVPKKIVTVIEPKTLHDGRQRKKYRQKKVAAYCRVSTDSEEQLVSYANQKEGVHRDDRQPQRLVLCRSLR